MLLIVYLSNRFCIEADWDVLSDLYHIIAIMMAVITIHSRYRKS